MGTVSFARLMEDASSRGYAVGYFESWNMESLLAVADAAEAARSPVILGFSGIAIPRPGRAGPEHLADYCGAGPRRSAARLSVPSCLLFNECPEHELGRGSRAARLSAWSCSPTRESTTRRLVEQTRRAADLAHAASAAAEGEPHSLPGIGGDLVAAPTGEAHDRSAERPQFVKETGIDAIAVNVGQAHLHGRGEGPARPGPGSAIRARRGRARSSCTARRLCPGTTCENPSAAACGRSTWEAR